MGLSTSTNRVEAAISEQQFGVDRAHGHTIGTGRVSQFGQQLKFNGRNSQLESIRSLGLANVLFDAVARRT
jgi:hypothetical protein